MKLNFQQLKSCAATQTFISCVVMVLSLNCSYLQTGSTPLYIACQTGHIPVVERLIAAKADINHQKKVPILHITMFVHSVVMQ